MKRLQLLSFLVVAVLVGFLGFSGPASLAQEATPDPEEGDIGVTLIDNQGDQVGTAVFTESEDGVTVRVQLDPDTLEPGERGIHIHERGACMPNEDPPFDSAGAHFDPIGVEHGSPAFATPDATPGEDEAHAGDLGNIMIEDDGSADFEVTSDLVTLRDGETALQTEEGTALLIHEDRDDLETDPDGESGNPVICGVIFPPANGATPEAQPDEEEGVAEITIEMVDIAFNPNEFEIPANTDITIHLPNNGVAVHNFYIDELDIRSVDVVGGDETSITINVPAGEYEFYCAVPGHREAGMVGTLTVVEG